MNIVGDDEGKDESASKIFAPTGGFFRDVGKVKTGIREIMDWA